MGIPTIFIQVRDYSNLYTYIDKSFHFFYADYIFYNFQRLHFQLPSSTVQFQFQDVL